MGIQKKLGINLLVLICLAVYACSPKVKPVVNKPVVPKNEPQNVAKPVKKFTEASISLMLPFKLNQLNLKTATKAQVENADMAIDFYQGVKMGIDSASNLGLNFKLNVFDSRDDNAYLATVLKRDALKQSNRHQRIFAVLEFASYTMRTGVHATEMAHALAALDGAYILEPQDFDLHKTVTNWTCPYKICKSHGEIIKEITDIVQAGDAVLVMSNRGFNGIHQKLISSIDEQFTKLNV